MQRARAAILFLLSVSSVSSVASQTQITAPSIHWDRNSLRLVAEDAFYPRIIRPDRERWLATYSRGDGVWTSRSADAGRTWEPAVRVGGFAHGHATNSELLKLADGRVMCMFNERDTRDAKARGTPDPDNGIAIAFSSDEGKTWTPPTRIYSGGPMWEPAATQRPDGEITLFFADEKPFPNSNDQQISMLASSDGGKTWNGPIAVSYRVGHRDGMPTAITLDDGRLVLSIEDNGINGGKYEAFKPVMVDVTDCSLKGEPPVAGDDPRRWSALAEMLSASVNAGAPYLVKLKDATVLSAQVEEGDGKRRMVVWRGDREARNFAGRTLPFEGLAPSDTEQLWNALMPVDDRHVLAIAGAKIEGQQGVWAIEGEITE